jgi:hypothetical protein
MKVYCIIILWLLFLFLVVLVIEIRVLCLLGRCSTVWITPPDAFTLVIFQMESCFCLGPVLHHNTPTYASCIAGVTGVSHCTPVHLMYYFDVCRKFHGFMLYLVPLQLMPQTFKGLCSQSGIQQLWFYVYLCGLGFQKGIYWIMGCTFKHWSVVANGF